jgi:MFS transporter, YQGE family, putative transporter
MFKEFIAKEKSYFSKLHTDAQKLITTIFLFNLIGPIFGIFMNAFIWRQTHDIILVAIYNTIVYLVIPSAFYLNGYLLRKFSPAAPYTFSLLISGVAVAVFVFLPKVTYEAVILYSIVDGLSAGVYWANRNLLTLKTTTTHDRIYFSSIETASTTVTSVVIPALIGWFITFGTPMHLYTALQGYQLVMIYMTLVIIRIGIISKTIHAADISVPKLFVKQVSNNWKKFRVIQFIYGLENAVDFFVPVLLVFILVGNEAALGTVQSISAIIASIIIYWLGKSLNTSHRLRLIAISIFITILGALTFGILYSAIGVFILYAAQALAQQFMWVGSSSVNYDLIDVDNKDASQHYAYVCDEEIYLNGGRVIGILFFMLIIYLSSNAFALRFAPIIFTSTQVFLLFAYKKIEENLKPTHN